MRQRLIIILMMLVLLGHSTSGLSYPDCVRCRLSGTNGISPLSYTTIRSNVFNGTQPSNDGCTSIDGQGTINCGVETTLMDCERGPSNNLDISDVSKHFVWNRTVNQQVTVVFKFDQQVDIRRIAIVFWNSPSNHIIAPNLTLFWSNDDSTVPSNQISFNIADLCSRDSEGRCRQNLNIDNDGGIRFQYFRIVMRFYDDREWIFLNEVVFCGIPAPYHLTHPPKDGYLQVVPTTTSMTTITCSLNDTIPASVGVTWFYNNSIIATPGIVTLTGNTTVLLLQNLRSSNLVGTYQCVFNDSMNGWTLKRSTVLVITDIQITQPSSELITFNAATSSVQLVCSLDPIIPSTTTVMWLKVNLFVPTPPNRVLETNDTTTVITIIDPQLSDEGTYHCAFSDVGLLLQRIITLAFVPQFIEPLTDNETITVNSSTPVVNVTCRVSDPIPSSATVQWSHNGDDVVLTPPRITNITSMDTAVLQIRNFSSSDVGVYQCVFTDANPVWRLSRSIIVFASITTTSTITTSTVITSTHFTTAIATSTTTLSTTGVMPSAPMGTDSSLTATTTRDAVAPPISTLSNPSTDVSSTTSAVAGGSGGGGNAGAIVAPIVVILILIIVIIVIVILFLVWKRRNRKKFNVGNHSETYYSSVQEAKLRSLTVNSDTLETRFGGTLNGNSVRSNVPVYSVPERKNSRKDASTLDKPKAVEKSQSLVSIRSSSPVIPHRTSAYDEAANEVANPFYDQAPVNHLAVTGETEVDNDSMDDEVLDDSFDEEDGPTPVHKGKKGRSPRRGKSKSPSKTPTRKPKQQSTSSSTPSNVLSPLKSTSSQTGSLQSSMQTNPLYASSQSLDNIELNIYDSIKNPKYSTSSDVGFAESIYSEISEPDTLITTEDPKIDSVKVAKDLYPYSSIYAEPLPLDKSESPPLVTVDNIKEVKQLGTGQFGEVVLAKTAGLSEYYLQLSPREDCSVSLQVAVKKLKLDSTKEMQTSFEKEIKFMSRLKDDNVIRLLGICTSGTPFIMMEYMENGDLNQYLQQFDLLLDPDKAPSPTQITPITLTYMAYQIASGMKYLSSLKYVHRDLATRNILVGKDYVVKIADFGMSQNLYSAYYFKVKGRAILPIRWMAYECFFGKFSVMTDVWAFGITLWEIFTIAKQQPYHEMGDQQVIDSALKGEKRILMAKPDNCPDELYEVMLSCWVHDPSKRANFADLFDALKEIMNRQ